MADESTSAVKTCRKTPWNKVDFILLFFLVASIITLIVTVTCVWYPYLETSTFIWSQCKVTSITLKGTTQCVNPPDNCIPDSFSSPSYHPSDWTDPFSVTSYPSSSSTSTLGPNVTPISISASTDRFTSVTSLLSSATLPTNPLTPTSTESTLPLSSVTPAKLGTDGVHLTSDFTEALASETVSSVQNVRRKRRQVAPSSAPYEDEDYCPAFPCYQVTVLYTNSLVVALSVPLLYNYNQLQTYPSCGYSSCDSDNEDNVQAVQAWIDTMETYYASRQIFGCYGNVKNFSQVIQHVNFTYSSGVNSIFWPILGLIGFFFALLFHRCRNVTMGRSSSHTNNRPPPEYDAASCQVNYTNMRPPTIATEPVYSTPPMVYGAEGGGNGSLPEKNPEAMGGEISFYGRSSMEMPNPWPMATQPPPYLELVSEGDYFNAPAEVGAVNININVAGTTDGEVRY